MQEARCRPARHDVTSACETTGFMCVPVVTFPASLLDCLCSGTSPSFDIVTMSLGCPSLVETLPEGKSRPGQ